MNAYLLLLFSSLFSYLPYILHSVYVHLTTSISLINTTCPKKVLFSYKLCITASISPTVTCHLFIFAIVFLYIMYHIKWTTFVFLMALTVRLFFQCFDTVGWATERASGL